MAWAFLAHYPYDRIVQIPIEDNFAKRPKLTCLFMAEPMNVTKLDKRILARKKFLRKYRMEFWNILLNRKKVMLFHRYMRIIRICFYEEG